MGRWWAIGRRRAGRRPERGTGPNDGRADEELVGGLGVDFEIEAAGDGAQPRPGGGDADDQSRVARQDDREVGEQVVDEQLRVDTEVGLGGLGVRGDALARLPFLVGVATGAAVGAAAGCGAGISARS